MKSKDVIKLIVSVGVPLLAGWSGGGGDHVCYFDVVRYVEQALVHPPGLAIWIRLDTVIHSNGSSAVLSMDIP